MSSANYSTNVSINQPLSLAVVDKLLILTSIVYSVPATRSKWGPTVNVIVPFAVLTAQPFYLTLFVLLLMKHSYLLVSSVAARLVKSSPDAVEVSVFQ